jgi:hypothetical protein
VTFDWKQYADDFTDEYAARLVDWRGYSPEYVDRLRRKDLIGIYKSQYAFPVSNNGEVTSLHYRIEREEQRRKG